MKFLNAMRIPIRRLRFALAICVACLLLGCQGQNEITALPTSSSEPDNEVTLKPVRLIVVSDPVLATVADRQWSARSDVPLELIQWTNEEFQSFLARAKGSPKEASPADALIYPTNMLGALAESGCIAAFPEYVSRGNFAANDYAAKDVFPLIRHSVIRWGEHQFAVSCGQPVMVVGYRTDVLEAVREQPPKTWDELSSLIKKIADFDFAATPDSKTDFVLAQPLSKRWAAELLLARAAPLAKNRARFSTLFDLRSMTAQIGTTPFVEALEAILHDQQSGSDEANNWGPCDSMRALRDGKCAVAIGWLCPESKRKWNSGEAAESTESSVANVSIQITPLPGSRRVYSFVGAKWRDLGMDTIQRVTYLPAAGICGSVFRQSRRQRAAWGLLVRLSGREWGHTVCSTASSSTIFRESQRTEIGRWVGPGWAADAVRSYGETVSESLTQPMWISSPRLNSGAAYSAALRAAVQDAMSETRTPLEALQDASEAWGEITAELGVSTQSDSYHRSLGLAP